MKRNKQLTRWLVLGSVAAMSRGIQATSWLVAGTDGSQDYLRSKAERHEYETT